MLPTQHAPPASRAARISSVVTTRSIVRAFEVMKSSCAPNLATFGLAGFAGTLATPVEYFWQHREIRAARHRQSNQSLGAFEICGFVSARAHLDRRRDVSHELLTV